MIVERIDKEAVLTLILKQLDNCTSDEESLWVYALEAVRVFKGA